MARKKYEMEIDPRKAKIISSCFFCNIICLSLGIFTENTFHFMLNILILATIFPYLKFEYRRLNKVGPRLVLFILMLGYTVFSLVSSLLSSLL